MTDTDVRLSWWLWLCSNSGVPLSSHSLVHFIILVLRKCSLSKQKGKWGKTIWQLTKEKKAAFPWRRRWDNVTVFQMASTSFFYITEHLWDGLCRSYSGFFFLFVGKEYMLQILFNCHLNFINNILDMGLKDTQYLKWNTWTIAIFITYLHV